MIYCCLGLVPLLGRVAARKEGTQRDRRSQSRQPY